MRAAADIVLRDGPAALTHRTVAARADVPLAATTYYFTGLDELLGEAGTLIAERWARHTRRVAGAVADPRTKPASLPAEARAELLVDAVLPSGGSGEYRGFYENLVQAGRHETLGRAYAAGRGLLDDAVAQLLATLDVRVSPQVLVAVVDGAAVSALSENRNTRELAVALVTDLVLGAGRTG